MKSKEIVTSKPLLNQNKSKLLKTVTLHGKSLLQIHL